MSGGRHFNDKACVYATLNAVHARTPITTLVHGACGATEDQRRQFDGADGLANEWAAENSVPVVTFPANWKRFKRGAGPERNKRMTDSGADLAIVFPGNSGTANFVKFARRAGIKLKMVEK